MSSVYMRLLVAISLTMTLGHVDVHSARVPRSEARTMTDKQKSDIVNKHNDLRTQEGAADMETMTWNETLALGAAEVAALCTWKRNNPPLPGTANFTSYGQNLGLYMISGASISMVQAVQSWYDEKSDYRYNKSRCKYGKWCGNYTQVVWARTRQVGCAYHYCDIMEESAATNAEFLVCNYIIMGNERGKKPFKKGPQCTKCGSGAAWCTGKLCNRECSRADASPDCWCAAHCHNCATLDKTTCRCSCADGWYGTDCTQPCQDNAELCNSSHVCGSPFTEETCPVLCKLCTPDPNAKPGQCPVVYGMGAQVAKATLVNRTSPDSSTGQSQYQYQQQCRTVTLLLLGLYVRHTVTHHYNVGYSSSFSSGDRPGAWA